MSVLRAITIGTALKLSMVMLIIVFVLWMLRGMVVRTSIIGLAEISLVSLILCIGSLVFDGIALAKSILGSKNGQIAQTIVLCTVSAVLALLSCAMLFGVMLGISEAMHPRP